MADNEKLPVGSITFGTQSELDRQAAHTLAELAHTDVTRNGFWCADCSIAFVVESELIRHKLKDAVVDAAKVARQLRLLSASDPSEYLRELYETKQIENAAVDALLQFEQEHKS